MHFQKQTPPAAPTGLLFYRLDGLLLTQSRGEAGENVAKSLRDAAGRLGENLAFLRRLGIILIVRLANRADFLLPTFGIDGEDLCEHLGIDGEALLALVVG